MMQKWLTGKNIGVAVLDTGIYPHIDFDCRIRAFLDMVHGKTFPYDDNGHGTHVAGSGTALNGKYKGVAPGCDIIAIKVLDEGGNGNKEQVIEALDWIKANRIKYNIRIINISVGTTQKESHRDLICAVESAWDRARAVSQRREAAGRSSLWDLPTCWCVIRGFQGEGLPVTVSLNLILWHRVMQSSPAQTEAAVCPMR